MKLPLANSHYRPLLTFRMINMKAHCSAKADAEVFMKNQIIHPT